MIATYFTDDAIVRSTTRTATGRPDTSSDLNIRCRIDETVASSRGPEGAFTSSGTVMYCAFSVPIEEGDQVIIGTDTYKVRSVHKRRDWAGRYLLCELD